MAVATTWVAVAYTQLLSRSASSCRIQPMRWNEYGVCVAFYRFLVADCHLFSEGESVSAELSVAQVLAKLEAQMAYHRERAAHHAELETFHQERRAGHTAEYETVA